MDGWAEDPAAGLITWSATGRRAAGGVTAGRQVFIAMVARLVNQLEQAARAS